MDSIRQINISLNGVHLEHCIPIGDITYPLVQITESAQGMHGFLKEQLKRLRSTKLILKR